MLWEGRQAHALCPHSVCYCHCHRRDPEIDRPLSISYGLAIQKMGEVTLLCHTRSAIPYIMVTGICHWREFIHDVPALSSGSPEFHLTSLFFFFFIKGREKHRCKMRMKWYIPMYPSQQTYVLNQRNVQPS